MNLNTLTNMYFDSPGGNTFMLPSFSVRKSICKFNGQNCLQLYLCGNNLVFCFFVFSGLSSSLVVTILIKIFDNCLYIAFRKCKFMVMALKKSVVGENK